MQVLFEVRDASPFSGPIEVFADKRLPFEPKGWLLDLRSAIGRSVEGLNASSSQVLYACYLSVDSSPCDAENVLFYNVGTSRFKNASQFGLLFERGFDIPPSAPSGQSRPHYQSYSLKSQSAAPERWVIGERLATWVAPLPMLKEPARVWYAVRSRVVPANLLSSAYQGPFGLDMELHVPGRTGLNVTSVMKPLLDGTISAFHSYEGLPPVEVLGRLARHLVVSESAIESALVNETGAILGARRLVVSRGEGVQWNPADELCQLCKIRVTYGAQEYAVRGSIFSILPRSGFR